MYKNQKLVFSRRLTAAEVKKIEATIEDAPGVFITDIKSHSVELIAEFNLTQGFTQSYNAAVNKLYSEFKFSNAIALDGEGYVLVFPSTAQLQSADMKAHIAAKGENLF